MRHEEEGAEALSPATLAILLTLVEADQHGYGMLKAIEAQPDAPRLGTGTLYAALQRLRSAGWIEESDARRAAEEDQRRRYYRITNAGRVAARREVLRLSRIVSMKEARALVRGARYGQLAEER